MTAQESWTEKYRPKKLNAVFSHSRIKKTLKKCLKEKNLPHLLFYGPPGTGKTSTIFALTKELFPSKIRSERVLELNASDERGINVVRNRIKNFAKNSVGKSVKNVPPWKIIILDEADSMTNDSQFALRRIIEKYSHITRFCIICNYKNKIIEPLISRCSTFRFKCLKPTQIINRLKLICKHENIDYSDKILEQINITSRGDLRKAITYLQMCYSTFGNDLDLETMYELTGNISKQQLEELFIIVKNGTTTELIGKIEDFENNGYSLVNQIKLIYDKILLMNISDEQKSKIFKKISDVNYHLTKGCNEIIEFVRLFIYIKMILI